MADRAKVSAPFRLSSKTVIAFVWVSILSIASSAIPQGPAWLECNADGKAGALGINVNNLSFGALESDNVMTALRNTGVAWIRINMYWAWTEREKGQFDWKDSDEAIARLQAAHINALITISGPVPCWALSSSGSGPCTKPQWTPPPGGEWSAYVAEVVKRYSRWVHYWEIWNEPDLIYDTGIADPKQRLVRYRDDILIPAAATVHRVDPNAKVVAPAFAAVPSGQTGPGPELEQALITTLSGSAASDVDIISLHSYFPESAENKAASARSALHRAGLGNKPIWITEDGIGTDTPSQLKDPKFNAGNQASFLSQEISGALESRAVQKIFWFALTDSMGHSNDYGLVGNRDYSTFSWTPRPAYTQLQKLAAGQCGGLHK